MERNIYGAVAITIAQTAAAETAKYILRLNSFWPASIFLKKC